MAKAILGIDIGSDSLKLALREADAISCFAPVSLEPHSWASGEDG